jgi:uncharacterized membrane protein
MTALTFAIAIVTIVLGVLAVEGDGLRFARGPTGLLTWFASGNWPAKIGATLTIVGVGALLRYAAIHVDVPPISKLIIGIALIVALGFASSAVGKGPARRALSLALGGAAFGVAYLTAYSAFALYGFLEDTAGLGLLAVTAIGGGVFAVTRSAQSLAVLAMIGAWVAPAFAIDDPGPLVTYGYYVAASALTMVMVRLRGWRPLIHLSFLFTLGGGVFFAWNAQYHAPEHFPVMSLMLVLLVALHVAMPLVEREARTSVRNSGVWSARLDMTYLLTLPAVALLFAYAIAPTARSLSALLMCLGSCWLGAAVYLWIAKRSTAVAHLTIGTCIVLIGAATRFQQLPWALIALAVAVGALTLAARNPDARVLHSALTGLVLVLAALNALLGLDSAIGAAFRNARFFEQLGAAVLLVIAALQCRRVHQPLDELLLSTSIGWALYTVGAEAIRLEFVSAILIVHWFLVVALLAAFFLARKISTSPALGVVLTVLLSVTGSVAALDTVLPIAFASLMVAPIALIAFAVRQREHGATNEDRIAAVLASPFVAMIWMNRISAGDSLLAVAAVVGAIALLVCHQLTVRARDWFPIVAKLFGVAAAVVLAFITLFAIGRTGWAIAAEVVLVGILALNAADADDDQVSHWARNAAIVGVALVLQAHLLRWFGPSGQLTVADLAHMRWPTLISLLWTALGAMLTLWARRRVSRSVWVAGAALLVAAAIKLVLVDIGTRLSSLGDITNILAVIAAGAVFLLVGWLAPMPPSSRDDHSATMTPREGVADRT